MNDAHPDAQAIQGPADCLAGGAEMGALMRSLDWRRTLVGPVAEWPQSLRTALSILLESRFPMYIAWGSDYVQFYNDGYRPILGSTKHPDAMGSKAAETFAESWHIIGPMFDDVMRGVAVGSEDWMLPLDRHGYLEECYFTFSYSPIRDESGGVGGVLVTVTETTTRVLSERRLRTLRELAAGAADTQNEGQAWQRSVEVLRENQRDLPFALLYTVEEDLGRVRLAGASGLDGGHPTVPLFVRLDGDSADSRESGGSGDSWRLAETLAHGRPIDIDGLAERGLSGGVWPEPVEQALVLPIQRGGRRLGAFVAGLSPRLALNESYRSFCTLVADQLAAAASNARALDDERKRAESLAELDRAKTVFFSNISHEFRTPLTLMQGPLQDLSDGLHGELTDPVQDQIFLIRNNCSRLLKLVNTLLDFSRVEAGRIEAAYQPTDLGALTADLASGFRSAVERAELEFVVDCPPQSGLAFVDREMWEKVVFNLLSNALKFTFEGRIEVRLRPTESGSELTVTDTGVGIRDEELPNVFKRFHRVRGVRARTQEGSGIGLALVQELVKLHGGTVGVQSRVGGGTTFTVFLPDGSDHLPQEQIGDSRRRSSSSLEASVYADDAWRSASARRPADSSTAANPSPGEPRSSSRILVVDDNADMRQYLQNLLAPHWQVDLAADGASALESALRSPPDLILSDIMMPAVDGFDLLRRVREDESLHFIPVILVSARAGEESRIEGLEAGADDYLVKPFSARELVARVRAHLQLARLRLSLDAERKRLRSLLMQAPAIVAVTRGPDHVFELSNPHHRTVVGDREVLGVPAREILPEIENSGAFTILDQVFASGQAHHETAYTFNATEVDGPSGRAFDWSCIPILDDEGKVESLLTFAHEVTDQVRARREAEAANRSKDEFLAMLGHELRNPLAPILTGLELMRLRGDGQLERERELVERQVRHLAGLVDDLLDISRITRGRVTLELQRIEMSSVIRRAVEMASPLLEARHQTLNVSADQAGLSVQADPGRLAQVVSNLLTNAAKYSEPGGVITLEVGRDEDEGMIELEVRDEGMGIPAELIPNIFELFTQGQRTLERSEGGLGLGLAIVRSLVEQHGGSVEAHSDGLGMGSRFVVRLPLPTGAPDGMLSGEVAPALSGASRRILVVDDNVDGSEALADLLRLHGHEVQVAIDGPTALATAAGDPPEIALVDIGLPLMDGYELASRLLDVPGLEALPLVAITGYGQTSDRERALASGFLDHLVKPVDFDQLIATVDRLTEPPADE